jgi:hypothetical protein
MRRDVEKEGSSCVTKKGNTYLYLKYREGDGENDF